MKKFTIRSHKMLLASGFAILLLTFVCSAEPSRKRVSVMDFEFGTVQRWWDGNWDIGKGISDLLVDRLLSEGAFRVIERRKLDTVLAEQNFSSSERADSSSAARIGKVLGVNAIILGSVTQFGTEKNDFSVGGIGGGRGGLGGGRMRMREGKASVGVTARIIDVSTGEVLASSNGRGESSRSGFLLGGLVVGRGGFGAGSVNMNSSQFRETILGEATYAAVSDLSRQLAWFAHKVPSMSQDVTGLVADVSGNSVILNVGRSHGLEAGTTLNVLRVERTVKDPATESRYVRLLLRLGGFVLMKRIMIPLLGRLSPEAASGWEIGYATSADLAVAPMPKLAVCGTRLLSRAPATGELNLMLSILSVC